MTLLDIPTYRQYTGDTTTPDAAVTDAITHAQALAEEYCRRPLESAERTETVTVDRRGHAFPRATPITAVATDGWTILAGGSYLRAGVVSWSWEWLAAGETDVTYTGGYTALTVPAGLAAAVAQLAYRTATAAADSTVVPAGAASVSVGDVSVTYAAAGGAGTAATGGIPADLAGTLRGYRRGVP